MLSKIHLAVKAEAAVTAGSGVVLGDD